MTLTFVAKFSRADEERVFDLGFNYLGAPENCLAPSRALRKRAPSLYIEPKDDG